MSSTVLTSIFDQLVSQTEHLIDQIKATQQGYWLPITPEFPANDSKSLNLACRLMQSFWYEDGQDGRETKSCFGFIALPEATLKLAESINQTKDTFKLEVQQFQKQNKQDWLNLKGELARRHPSLQEQLHFSGLSRLHLKQTWRSLPVIPRSPSRIGFNWYQSGRSIQKMTTQQAYDALAKLDTDSPHIKLQLDALGKLPNNTKLAKVQNLAPTMRANIFFEDGESPSRQAMNISLPILIKANNEGILPKHNSPEIEAPKTRMRAVRSDRKIEDEPFLPSIRVHKYN